MIVFYYELPHEFGVVILAVVLLIKVIDNGRYMFPLRVERDESCIQEPKAMHTHKDVVDFPVEFLLLLVAHLLISTPLFFQISKVVMMTMKFMHIIETSIEWKGIIFITLCECHGVENQTVGVTVV